MIYYIQQFAHTALQNMKDYNPKLFYKTYTDFDIVEHNRKMNTYDSQWQKIDNKYLKNRYRIKRIEKYSRFITDMAQENDKLLYIE